MQHRGLAHRDLKPDNVLLHSSIQESLEIRLADFGFAAQISRPKNDSKEVTMICGTSGYIAPEVLAGHGYSNKSDVFSIGSIMYALFTGNCLSGSRKLSEVFIDLNKKCEVNIKRDLKHLS